MGNKNLEKTKSAKNNEYYTPMSEIEHELKAYQDKFAGKIVFCNCDHFFLRAIFQSIFDQFQ